MLKRILVANRGEIACRIFRTARRMGIETVAVYSEADRNALHVEMADAAVAIGPAPAAESYLSIARIVEACRATGADAVHPGYGFLSENPAFARALDEVGIVFIGPPVAAMEAMADKIAAKAFAAEAGVRTVPGCPDIIDDADHAARIAASIGYPVIIKASAGGGGKGMRVARTEAETREGFGLARSEARSAFGDDRIFIETFIDEPRHIEIQVLADAHGAVIHLGERECSIQRRNQKVIEEAPSAFLDEATRSAMGAQAVALARAVGYRSAGTVEFIVDCERNFYFLEMNTRLQVEHPVTELVTGIDLVEEMFRIAAGEPLRLAQEDVRMAGWAVEARVYAEDPSRDFLPSAGRLTRYRPPEEGAAQGVTVRIDGGVAEGSDVPLFYDPMIAKLCTHAPDRLGATAAMADALDAFELAGVRHNIPFLAALMAHPRWREGRLSTRFISDEFPEGFRGAAADRSDRLIVTAIAAAAGLMDRDRVGRLAGQSASGPRPVASEWVLAFGREQMTVAVLAAEIGAVSRLDLSIAGAPPIRVETRWRPGVRTWRGAVDGVAVIAQVRREGDVLHVARRGSSYPARLLTFRAAELDLLMPARATADMSGVVLCPMPGLVLSIAVVPGQKVAAGDTLATVEAMKMENVLRADQDASVARILVRPGDSLSVDAVILEYA